MSRVMGFFGGLVLFVCRSFELQHTNEYTSVRAAQRTSVYLLSVQAISRHDSTLCLKFTGLDKLGPPSVRARPRPLDKGKLHETIPIRSLAPSYALSGSAVEQDRCRQCH